MAHANANIAKTSCAVSITAGHHQLSADEGVELGGKDIGPALRRVKKPMQLVMPIRRSLRRRPYSG
jgi:hypothetical protein